MPKKSQTKPFICKTCTAKIIEKTASASEEQKQAACLSFITIINVQRGRRGFSWLRLAVSKCIKNIVRRCSSLEHSELLN